MVTKTKRKVRRYIPSFVVTNGKTHFIYKLDIQPMTMKKVKEFDLQVQNLISEGKLQTSLAYVEA